MARPTSRMRSMNKVCVLTSFLLIWASLAAAQGVPVNDAGLTARDIVEQAIVRPI